MVAGDTRSHMVSVVFTVLQARMAPFMHVALRTKTEQL